jgi:hypothetical protein
MSRYNISLLSLIAALQFLHTGLTGVMLTLWTPNLIPQTDLNLSSCVPLICFLKKCEEPVFDSHIEIVNRWQKQPLCVQHCLWHHIHDNVTIKFMKSVFWEPDKQYRQEICNVEAVTTLK